MDNGRDVGDRLIKKTLGIFLEGLVQASKK